MKERAAGHLASGPKRYAVLVVSAVAVSPGGPDRLPEAVRAVLGDGIDAVARAVGWLAHVTFLSI
jgi:hypothetical protein